MLVISFVVLSVIQVSFGCVEHDHLNPFEAHPLNKCDPHSTPLPHPNGCGTPAPPFDQYIQSLTRIGHCPWPACGPCLQTAVHSPLICEPLVPILENHVGHHLIKTIKHVPVTKKFCKPELVIRTRHIPFVKHKKRIFFEPYTVHIPVTDRLIRQVIHQYQVKVPVVHKIVRPYTYQTVRHVPASYAKCFTEPQCKVCPSLNHFPEGALAHPFPTYPLPLCSPAHSSCP